LQQNLTGYVIELRVEILCTPLHLAPSRRMSQRNVQQLEKNDEAPLGVVILLVTRPGFDVNAVRACNQFRIIRIEKFQPERDTADEVWPSRLVALVRQCVPCLPLSF
jgi:hypothetical protein